mgnify:CR=1 FL=1
MIYDCFRRVITNKTSEVIQMKKLWTVAKSIVKGTACVSAIYLAYDKALVYYISAGVISDNGYDYNYLPEFVGALKTTILSFI